MAVLRCVDGTALDVRPEPVLARDGVPYELTLRLLCDGRPFGAVGERCGWFLAATARSVRSALGSAGVDEAADCFPPSSIEGGLRAWATDEGRDADDVWPRLERYLPRDRDLFAFRHRDPDDVASAGELRCSVRPQKEWVGGDGVAGGGGHWRMGCRAVVEAWGDDGTGVRAVLTAPELASWLDALLAEAAALGCDYSADAGDVVVRRPAG